jgi:hypothetical protein
VFAWGAVFYELLSGRIPYEGPDTKTTNSYVVQGNAAPPTRHDTSIPEPLSQVVMTALQPSDRARFKDASEAEQTLREAWDRCLMQGIIHPAVLAMEETSHDKAPARMHEPRGANRQPPGPPIQNDSQEVTAIDSKILGQQDPRQPFQIESSKKGREQSDDDPTMLHVRDDVKPVKDKGTMRGIAAPGGGKTPPPQLVVRGNDESNVSDTKVDGHRAIDDEKKTPRWIWIAIAAVVVAAAAVALLYFLGYIK